MYVLGLSPTAREARICPLSAAILSISPFAWSTTLAACCITVACEVWIAVPTRFSAVTKACEAVMTPWRSDAPVGFEASCEMAVCRSVKALLIPFEGSPNDDWTARSCCSCTSK